MSLICSKTAERLQDSPAAHPHTALSSLQWWPGAATDGTFPTHQEITSPSLGSPITLTFVTNDPNEHFISTWENLPLPLFPPSPKHSDQQTQ